MDSDVSRFSAINGWDQVTLLFPQEQSAICQGLCDRLWLEETIIVISERYGENNGDLASVAYSRVLAAHPIVKPNVEVSAT